MLTRSILALASCLSDVMSKAPCSSCTLLHFAVAHTDSPPPPHPDVFPLIGGRKVEHLHDNISALTVKLTAEDIAAIEGVKPFDLGFPHNFIGIDPCVSDSIAPPGRALY